MASDSVTSGELFFRLCLEDDKNPNSDMKIPAGMRSFLKRKDESNKDIANMRQRIVQVLISRLSYLSSLLPLIRGMTNSVKLRIFREKLLIKNFLESKGQEFDACALQSILRYAAVLQQEILDAQKSLMLEREMKAVLDDQARISRDLLLFSSHLSLETKSRIELHHLSTSSAQYVRCVKAVHDNLHNSFGFNQNSPIIPSPENVTILNIFKLKHSVLARSLQKSTAKVSGAKMKGLFCCMPIDSIYRFTAYGLREQALPEIVPDYPADPAIRDCFRTPWIFCNQDTPLAPIPSELRQALHNAGLATRNIQAAPSQRPVLRFSKYSTLSTMLSYSEPQLRQGLCLALCRVLIVRVKTIPTFIEDFDISSAFQQGYDAVYSSLSEEYALLQPQYVLPEFFIHADFTSLQNRALTGAYASSTPASPIKQGSDAATTTNGMSVLPTHLRVKLSSDAAAAAIAATSNVNSLALSSTGKLDNATWVHNHSAVCPQQVLLQNHYQALSETMHPALIAASAASKHPRDGPAQTALSPHGYLLIKQGALHAIESAVDEFRLSLSASKLMTAKRMMQWCSEEQKLAVRSYLAQLPRRSTMHRQQMLRGSNASAAAASSPGVSLDGSAQQKQESHARQRQTERKSLKQTSPTRSVPSASVPVASNNGKHERSSVLTKSMSKTAPTTTTSTTSKDRRLINGDGKLDDLMVMANESLRAVQLTTDEDDNGYMIGKTRRNADKPSVEEDDHYSEDDYESYDNTTDDA